VYIQFMSDRYNGIYRNGTNRLQGFDYGSSNHYYITICVRGRNPVFGEIKDGEMFLSPLGEIVHTEWNKTVSIRETMNLKIGEFVIMPDHFHAILSVGQNVYNKNFIPNKMGIQSNNIGSVIRGFKAAVTTYARKNSIVFDWQPRYYDRIIRDEDEYSRIEKYIQNNIQNYQGK